MQTVAGLSVIADLFEGFIVDQWGVLHNGVAAYPAALEALRHLAEQRKRVVLLSNTGVCRGDGVNKLREVGIESGLYDNIVTSGDLFHTWWHNVSADDRSYLGGSCYLLGRSPSFLLRPHKGLTLVDDIRRASFCLVAGIDFGRWERRGYDQDLAAAIDRQLTLVCINRDDLVVSRDGVVRPGPGRIARLYETAGGALLSFGKPDPRSFFACLDLLAGLPASKVLVVGDSLGHDVAGARGAGLASVLVCSGVHAGVLDGPDWRGSVAQLCREERAHPTFAMRHLAW